MIYRTGQSFYVSTTQVTNTPQPVGHTEESTAGYPKADLRWVTFASTSNGPWPWGTQPDYDDDEGD